MLNQKLPNVFNKTLKYFKSYQSCVLVFIKDNNPKSSSTKYAPWFKHRKSSKKEKIIFGHWATLDGKFCTPTIHALDTGCVWGRKLRIMDIDNEILIEYKSNN